MDPLDREMFDQLHNARVSVSRNRAIAQIAVALIAFLFTVGTVAGVWNGAATWVAWGLGAVALVLALLANRIRTRDHDDETTAPAVTPDDRTQARREHSGELEHLGGLARLQTTYLTGAGVATLAGLTLILIYT